MTARARLRRRGAWLPALLLVSAFLGCEQDAKSKSKSTPGSDPAKWACSVDRDCMNSCSQGAVNAKWYAGAKIAECKDGCSSKGSAPPRCLEGACVAFVRDANSGGDLERSDECTQKP